MPTSIKYGAMAGCLVNIILELVNIICEFKGNNLRAIGTLSYQQEIIGKWVGLIGSLQKYNGR